MLATAPLKLSLKNVSKEFLAPRSLKRTLAVSDVSLDVASGEFVCIVGPSGCGKSTVMNMIAGLDTPSAGSILMNGAQVSGPGAERGVMFQDYALFPWLTVQENIGFGLRNGRPAMACQRRQSQSVWVRISSWFVLVGRKRNTRTSCPAACANGSRWPGFWPMGRTCC